MSARIFTIATGVWLFISSFLFPQSVASRTNTLGCAVLVVAFGALALMVPKARYLSLAVGLWVFFSPWSFVLHEWALWNNLLCGIAVFIASLLPSSAAEAHGLRLPRRPQAV
jgi:hypothetical protein